MNGLNSADDVLLATILKLVGGDQERCHQMLQAVREQYPAKSIRWCKEKVIYDLRHGKSQVQSTSSSWETKVAKAYKTSTPLRKTNIPAPPEPVNSPSKITRWGPQGVILGGKTTHSADSSTKYKLYYLTKDWNISERLVRQVLYNNPGQSEQWAYEKAIFDLERDRL